jgi:triacylglycerol lipase
MGLVLEILLVVLLTAAVAAAILLLVLHLRRERRERRVVVERRGLPVVLAHGVFGFDEMRVGSTQVEYFRGVAEHLQGMGAEVHRPRVPPVSSVAVRAQQLADYIRELPGPVNIVAHSLGGLDARYAITRLGLDDRVASLTSVGAPHRGTPLADHAALLDKLKLHRLLGLFGLDVEAFFDMSREQARKFNQLVPDVEEVSYLCVVGVAPSAPGQIHPILAPPHRYLLEKAGPNDGLVPRDSQVWGEVVGEVEADHFAQVGWSRHFNVTRLYGDLLRELRDRGF